MITKQIAWDADKSRLLKQKRGISFEDVLSCISGNGLLDVVPHPNREKYSQQMMLIVAFKDYVYLVPFVENENTIFLKTIIPNRQATKKYLNR